MTTKGMPLTKQTMSGRRVSWLAVRATSNSAVTWKALLRGCSQSMKRRVCPLVSPSMFWSTLLPRVRRS